jgi:integrase/recombinase XerD
MSEMYYLCRVTDICNFRKMETRQHSSSVLSHTAVVGSRISEALALRVFDIDLGTGTVNIETLKKRIRSIVRQVPVRHHLLAELERSFKIRELQRDSLQATRRVWSSSLTTAWRRVRKIMATAGIRRQCAMPKEPSP